MTAEQCAVADWGALGYQDAAESGADRYSDRAESCAEKGFAPDGRAYYAGHGEGMRMFCVPERAFHFARRGGTFSGVCPPDLQYEFQLAYSDGRLVNEAMSALSSAEGELSSLEQRRRNYDEDIANTEEALRTATTEEERVRLRSEIDRFRRERRDTIRDIEAAQQNVYFAQRRVDDIRFQLAARWGAW